MKTRLMNNVGLKILAFLAAAMLWMIVVNIDDPIIKKTYTNIPVSVINAEVLAQEQQTFQIVDNTQEVSVTITARRKVLSDIKAEDIVAVADMKELTLKTQIPIDVSVNGYNGKYESAYAIPRNLQVKLEEEETKKFPIVPTTTGTVRDGFVLGEIKAVPEKVSIRGPKSVIDKINRVEAAVSVSGLSEDSVLQTELVLYDGDNNAIDQKLLTNNLGTEGVGVSVTLLRTKNVPLEFNTSEIGTANGYEFDGITYEPQEIQISGSEDVLKRVSKIEIPSSALRLSDLTSKTEQVVDVSDYLPEGVKLADENAGSVVVTISIEKDGSKTFDVTVGTITVNNLPADLQMRYATVDAVEIQVRGPSAVLETYTPDRKVSIDLKEYKEPGTYDVPVDVEIPDKCTLENKAKVKVILEKKE